MRDRGEREARMEDTKGGENPGEREARVEQARGTMGWPRHGLRRTEVGSLGGSEAVCGLSCPVANERRRNTTRTKMQSGRRIKTRHWRCGGRLRVLSERSIETKRRNTKRRKGGRTQDSLDRPVELCRILSTSAIDKKSSI